MREIAALPGGGSRIGVGAADASYFVVRWISGQVPK
jgi:hypothetical protein